MNRTKSFQFSLSSRTAIGALIMGAGLLATPALAQDAAPTSSSAAQVDEVIVTATRREEALSDVPVAVTALSGKQVAEARIQNFQDIPAAVPGATFVSTKGQSTANIQIRGQAQTTTRPTSTCRSRSSWTTSTTARPRHSAPTSSTLNSSPSCAARKARPSAATWWAAPCN